MMRVFATVAAGLVLVSCATVEEPSPGRAIAVRDCGACHATGRTDQSRMPAALPFRQLGAKYDVEGLAEALAEGISVGHPMMPEYAYPPEEIEQLIDYLKSIQPDRELSR